MYKDGRQILYTITGQWSAMRDHFTYSLLNEQQRWLFVKFAIKCFSTHQSDAMLVKEWSPGNLTVPVVENNN